MATIEVGADVDADLDAPDLFRFLARHRNHAEPEEVAVIDLPAGLIELVRRETTFAAG